MCSIITINLVVNVVFAADDILLTFVLFDI